MNEEMTEVRFAFVHEDYLDQRPVEPGTVIFTQNNIYVDTPGGRIGPYCRTGGDAAATEAGG